MATNNCEHAIGMMYAYENTGLITLNELKEHIEQEKRMYSRFWKWEKPYELSDYADKRKTVDMYRFNYCPLCGEKIDWKAIKKGENK